MSIIPETGYVKIDAIVGMRGMKSKSFLRPSNREGGFLLPVVIALGLGFSTMSVLVLETVANNSETLNNQQYKILAREAARSGLSVAAKCMENQAPGWSWIGNLQTLDCVGGGLPKETVATNDAYDTTFEVAPPDYTTYSGGGVILTSVGSVNIKDASGAIAYTEKQTIRAFAKTATGSAAYIRVANVSTGPSTACALTDDATLNDNWVYCWGSNSNGLLGAGRNFANDRTTFPVAVAGDPAPAYPGYCNGFMLGSNCVGAWNPAATPARSTPTDMAGKKVVKVSVGKTHACAVATDSDGSNGRAYCWGGNGSGQLGNRSTDSSSIPVAVDTQDTFQTISRRCVNGIVVGSSCIGLGAYWTTDTHTHPASALRNKTVIDITAGSNFTCALTDERFVYCWGDGAHGQLGLGSVTSSTVPVAVDRTFAGTPYVPGTPAQPAQPAGCGGFLRPACTTPAVPAVPATPAVPASALLNKQVRSLATIKGDAETMCVITTDNKSVCWGENYAGQAGNGAAIPASDSSGIRTVHHGNPNQCNSIRPQAQSAANTAAPTPAYRVEVRPVEVSSTQIFDTIIISGSISGDDPSERGSFGGGTGTTPSTSSGSRETRVTAKTASSSATPNRVYQWGGAFSWSNSSDCYRNSDTYGGDYSRATASKRYTFSGVNTPEGPRYNGTAGTGLNQLQLNLIAGDYENGLFCAQAGSDIQCDRRTISPYDGQLGNGYYCDNFAGLFCNPPNGPQVVSRVSGALEPGLIIEAIDTGRSGYTCAVASGRVYCWGVNGEGQLGKGNTSRSVRPSPVSVAGGSDLEVPGGAVVMGTPREWIYL